MPTARETLITTLFPTGIPSLWCPPLTHFSEDGLIDAERIKAHLAHLRPSVPCLLVPGSTSEGWELDEAEEFELLDIILACAREMDFSIMIGMLRTQSGEARKGITAMLNHVFKSERPSVQMLKERNICGFAVTAPKGKNLPQSTIHEHLQDILNLGLPTALYQLPQITENEISPETVAALAASYSNLYLMKDTSGKDRVVTSGLNFDGLFFVRGAEGDYAKWYKPAGGRYDGFLLSSANCFSRELKSVLQHIEAGRLDDAEMLSNRVSEVMTRMLHAASALPFGNAFTNANKAIDHFFAYGPHAELSAKIRTRSGAFLPRALLEETRTVLRNFQLMPAKGYLE